jgi:hypothetical protein
MNKKISPKPTSTKKAVKKAQKGGAEIRLPKTARKAKKLTSGTGPKIKK